MTILIGSLRINMTSSTIFIIQLRQPIIKYFYNKRKRCIGDKIPFDTNERRKIIRLSSQIDYVNTSIIRKENNNGLLFYESYFLV